MKKLFYLVVAIAAVGMMASCGGASTPGAAAKSYVEEFAAGNYDKFMEGLYVDPDEDMAEIEQQKTMLTSALKEKGDASKTEKQGISKVEVVSETIAEDGQTATVMLRYTYGNGETEESEMQMRLGSDNKWKWELGK